MKPWQADQCLWQHLYQALRSSPVKEEFAVYQYTGINECPRVSSQVNHMHKQRWAPFAASLSTLKPADTGIQEHSCCSFQRAHGCLSEWNYPIGRHSHVRADVISKPGAPYLRPLSQLKIACSQCFTYSHACLSNIMCAFQHVGNLNIRNRLHGTC